MSRKSQGQAEFDRLSESIVACTRCPRLVEYRERIAVQRRFAFKDQTYWGRPVPSAGDPSALLLIVGLAPGAHGSNRTGRMFTGDGSGDFLTPALYRAGFANQPNSEHAGDGLMLRNACIVAVVHCAPPENKPTKEEILNCRPHLLAHLALLQDLRVILALGKIAFDGILEALTVAGTALSSPRPRFEHGAHYRLGRFSLFSSYHPSRQNTQTGRLTARMFDRILARVNAELLRSS